MPASSSGRRLFAFDREIGCRWVAGADEAGRGSLAGPIVGAAVLFDLERLTLGDRRALSRLNDSKQHTEESREELYPLVLRAAARSAIVSRSVRAIDGRGLHVSNLDALRSALLAVSCPGTVCLVDGFNVPEMEHEQRAVIDGDCRSAAIAAASVLAKVSRDRYMRRIHEQHPAVGLRHQRRLLDARAPRRDRRARGVAAAPDVVRFHRLQPAQAGLRAREARCRRPRATRVRSRRRALRPWQPTSGASQPSFSARQSAPDRPAGRGRRSLRTRSRCGPGSGALLSG